VYASQQTSHSSGLRAMCLGLSHWLKSMPGPFSAPFFFWQVNASRPACMTSLSSAMQNSFHGSQTSSHFFWLPSLSIVNCKSLKVKPSFLLKSHSEASHTISKKTARSCHTKQVRTIMVSTLTLSSTLGNTVADPWMELQEWWSRKSNINHDSSY